MKSLTTFVFIFVLSGCKALSGNGYTEKKINCHDSSLSWAQCLRLAIDECNAEENYGQSDVGIITGKKDNNMIKKVNLGYRVDDLVITCENLR